jgi:hypothetical protein
MRRNLKNSWVTYERSYLVTAGLALIGLPAFVWYRQGDEFAEWPTLVWLLLAALAVLGLWLVGLGFMASRKRIENWAEALSKHEAGIILMILAYPVYLVMSLFVRRKS